MKEKNSSRFDIITYALVFSIASYNNVRIWMFLLIESFLNRKNISYVFTRSMAEEKKIMSYIRSYKTLLFFIFLLL
jgi:hypothetical protein